MAMTLIEKIIANHSKFATVKPGDIIDIEIDARAARDFGGPNVVKNMQKNGLTVKDPEKTFLTFDTNPTGSDQKYANNQQICRLYARQTGIKVFDINVGIGTHTFMDKGMAWPGSTAVTTDSHANILGAIGAFGQGMGDKDIAAAWANGTVWFKVPKSIKLNLNGKRPDGITVLSVYHFLVAALSAMGICVGFVFLLALAFSNQYVSPVVPILLGFGIVLSFILVLANAAAGWALLKMLEWGRWLSVALGVLSLLLFPVGTIIGAVVIWYLLQPEVKDAFLSLPASEESESAPEE